MPRPSKRTAASRQAAAHSMLKRRRITASSEISGAHGALDSEIQVDNLSSDATEGSESESDAQSEWMLSEEEDEYPIGQPEAGWEEAEKALHGYSKTRVYRQKISYHKNKEEIKRRREEAKALKAGIPATQRAKPVWGDISRMFNSRVLTSASPTQPSQPSGSQEPSPPADWAAPVLMAAPGYGSSELSLVRPYLPPSFEEAFLSCQSFENEARELELWLKKQKGRVTGDWLVRVECLRDLLQMQHRNICRDQEERRKDWVQYSEALARRVKRSSRWAASLRLWERNWYETRSPPPCPRRGRHIKRQSLFFDEGVALAVREYLNTAMWRASPKGVCEAVANHLQSENSAVSIMRIDAVLCNSQKGRKGVSERTANRWLVRLGWVYGRNKKGYCDGHERPDVVEYREKVFCPRMKVSSNVDEEGTLYANGIGDF